MLRVETKVRNPEMDQATVLSLLCQDAGPPLCERLGHDSAGFSLLFAAHDSTTHHVKVLWLPSLCTMKRRWVARGQQVVIAKPQLLIPTNPQTMSQPNEDQKEKPQLYTSTS
jgi:hypothetical protein